MAGARGLTTTGVPPFPSFLIFIKLAIFGLSFVILALGAYAASGFGGGASGFLIFVALKTLIIFGATIAIERFAPQMFFRIIFFIAYIFGIIFWLSAWAWAASSAAFWLSWDWYDYYVGQAGALAACAGLGALVWILSIIQLVFFVRACLTDSSATAPTPLQGVQTETGYPKQDAPLAQQYSGGQASQVPYGQPAPYAPPQQQYPAPGFAPSPAPEQQYPTQSYSPAPEQQHQQYPPQQYGQHQQPYGQ